MAIIQYLREIDETGSLHPCWAIDEGAKAFVPIETRDTALARVAELEAENARLTEALERLGSSEAFTTPFTLHQYRQPDMEFKARVEFARASLTKTREPQT